MSNAAANASSHELRQMAKKRGLRVDYYGGRFKDETLAKRIVAHDQTKLVDSAWYVK